MTNGFPVTICVIGAIADFALWAKLRNFKVREKPPASRAGLSVEQRQQKVKVAAGIMFGCGWVFLAGAALLYWLGNSR